jgi:hypothetical protein
LGMGVMSWLASHLVHGSFDSGGTIIRLTVAGVLLVSSGAIYLILARLLKLSEAWQIWRTAIDLLPGGDRGLQ